MDMQNRATLRLLSEADIRGLDFSLGDALRLTEQAYREDAAGAVEVPTKIGVHPHHPGSFLHAMPAWAGDSRALGMKWVSYFPGNFDRGLEDSTGIIILNDPEHGHPVCIMEGMHVTFLRTAACAAVAVRALIAREPEVLMLVGCGGLGRWSLRVMTAAFPSIRRILVSSKRRETRERFSAEMAAEGPWEIVPVDDIAAAGAEADIVVSSVPPSQERPVTLDALKPGSFYVPLDLMNAWADEVPGAMDRIVADNPAHLTDLMGRARPGASLPRPVEWVQQLVAEGGPKAGPDERTFVGVCGIASTDVVIGWEIFRRAAAADKGTLFAMT
ncbi:hypothetical protein GI374_16645 [Paracoccus sp. S-4012]|uniref:ornithine cyclodeaminase family protein n=1 Tax=Paracoccus sp. S-4012 TaxID=2665648 RepID=UPI0012B1309C|nr:ornithine cyclodeaminase family protein [Paracoccus sp. S-4012]MRX52009.1 hypothetical protein [Paracoccus sp. S-4012]